MLARLRPLVLRLSRPVSNMRGTQLARFEGLIDEVIDLEVKKLKEPKKSKPPALPSTPEVRWTEMSRAARDWAQHLPPNDTYSGRKVIVQNGRIDAAFTQLDNTLSRNKVRQYLRLTARHEKAGDKRRRLSSERWRRIYAHEVRKNVQLAVKIRHRAG